MKVDPYPGSQHAGRQLDSMERATDRLRRIITTALAAVVWKQHGAAHAIIDESSGAVGWRATGSASWPQQLDLAIAG
jgi:hypothetical protein